MLEFETKKDMTMDMWMDRLDKIESFFGPGIKAKVCFSSHLLKGLVDIAAWVALLLLRVRLQGMLC